MRSHTTSLRQGSMAIELLVAATLLMCMIGILGPLTVRTSRICNDGRHMRMALDELSNQLDWLTSLDRDELTQALENLAPSEQVQQVLPDASLHGETLSDADGTRLILTLDWERPMKGVPISLTGWMAAQPVDRTEPEANSSAAKEESL
jgi:hypothetical protein